MANSCVFYMRAVSKDKSALERLVKVMRYKDPDLALFRCFSALARDWSERDGVHGVTVVGDCAWDCKNWLDPRVKTYDMYVYAKNDDGSTDPIRRISVKNRLVPLDELCRTLCVGIELYAEETGNCFRERILVRPDGSIPVMLKVDWDPLSDEDGETPECIPGFGVFIADKEIIGGEDDRVHDKEH